LICGWVCGCEPRVLGPAAACDASRRAADPHSLPTKKTLRHGASFSLLAGWRDSNPDGVSWAHASERRIASPPGTGPTAHAKRQLRAGDHSPPSNMLSYSGCALLMLGQ
jgi:hypothetical protein